MKKTEKTKTSNAQKNAVKKYEQKHDRINTLLPKGTIERIKATGAKSVNSFIVNAVEKELHNAEKTSLEQS